MVLLQGVEKILTSRVSDHFPLRNEFPTNIRETFHKKITPKDILSLTD